MSPIYITEADVRALVDMRGAISAVREAFIEQAAGRAQNQPRQRASFWGSRLNVLTAGAATGRFALKAYAGTKAPTVYHVLLYDNAHGLVAIIEAKRLGQLRTGAASAVATERLAPQGALRLGCIGAGTQAAAQLEALLALHSYEAVQVFARDRSRLAAFCALMSEKSGVLISSAESADACARDSNVLVLATTSRVPVISDAAIIGAKHINAVGANAAIRSELSTETYARASVIVTDDLEQARQEAGELVALEQEGRSRWSEVQELARIVSDPEPTGELSIFKSLGSGLEDLALASLVYDRARESGLDRFKKLG